MGIILSAKSEAWCKVPLKEICKERILLAVVVALVSYIKDITIFIQL